MPPYKLTYFNARGRAEICRLLFVLAGQEFEDVRITREEWPALKSKTPFGQLPILEIGGKVFAQTVAISNFLAIEFGFHGKTNLEILAIDQAVCLVQEAVAASSKVFHEPDPERKVHYLKDLKQVVIPHLMSCCETLLVDSGTGYLVGDKLTLADLTVWNYINGTENRLKLTGLADSYPNVKAMFDKLEKEGRIQAYLKQRQPADF